MHTTFFGRISLNKEIVVKNYQFLILKVSILNKARKRELHSLAQEVINSYFEEALHRLDSLLDLFQGLITIKKCLYVAHGDVKALYFTSHIEILDRYKDSCVAPSALRRSSFV